MKVALEQSEGSNLVFLRKTLSPVLLIFGFLVVSPAQTKTQAQTMKRRVEAAVHYTSINLSVFDSVEAGGGVRLTYHINDHFDVEAEGNLFEFFLEDHPTDDVVGAQGLLGVRAGLQYKRIGVFAKLRPGVVNFPSLRGPRGPCSLLPCEGSRRGGNRFAVDAGAVVEFYPAEKIILRMDIGDTMIRFSDDHFFKSSTMVRINDGFSHNLQWGASIGYRF